MKGELQRIWKESAIAQSRYYSMERLRKTKKNLGPGNR